MMWYFFSYIDNYPTSIKLLWHLSIFNLFSWTLWIFTFFYWWRQIYKLKLTEFDCRLQILNGFIFILIFCRIMAWEFAFIGSVHPQPRKIWIIQSDIKLLCYGQLCFDTSKNKNKFSSMALKLINILWIRTCSQPYWKIMYYYIVLETTFHGYNNEKLFIIITVAPNPTELLYLNPPYGSYFISPSTVMTVKKNSFVTAIYYLIFPPISKIFNKILFVTF